MLKVIVVLAFCAGCLTARAAAAPNQVPVKEALEKAGYSSFLRLAKAAGAAAPSPDAVLTMFVPTNAAIDDFLKRMDLTLDEVQKRPALSAAVVAYHVLPRVKGSVADVRNSTRQDPLVALTADNAHFLKFYMGSGGERDVVLQDVQGNTAKVVGKGVEVGKNLIFYGIDSVMLSGDVFYTLSDMLSKHPAFQPLKALFDKSGVYAELKAQRGTFTVFAPTAKAVAAAEPKLSALSTQELRDVLRYHVVPAPLSIPAQLKMDSPYETAFKGHFLSFGTVYVPPPFRPYNPRPRMGISSSEPSVAGPGPRPKGMLLAKVPAVAVVPEDGIFGGVVPAEVGATTITLDNLFANRVIIHGIDAVLRPNLPSQKQQKSAAAAPAGAGKPAAAPAAAAPAGGRKLLQVFRQTGPSLSSAGLTSTQSSIRDAVEGRTDVADAARAGSASARSVGTRCWNCVQDTFLARQMG